MDFRDIEEDVASRAEARAVLEGAVAALPGPEPATVEERAPYWRQFQRAIHAAGYAGLSWPRAYGGRDATLLVWSPDYDGNGKAWVRFDDGEEATVGGSRVERG